MKTSVLAGVVIAALALGASIACNFWQHAQVRHRDLVIQEKIEMLVAARKESDQRNDSLQKTIRDLQAREITTIREHAADIEKYDEQLARYERVLNQSQRSMSTAADVRQSVVPPAVETYAPRSVMENDAPAIPIARIKAEVARRAEKYFKTEHVNGSGVSLVFDFNTDIDEPRARQGWVGRYEVTGEAWFQYYDSVWGGNFSSYRSRFSAEVEVAGGAIRVLDFERRS
jgi:hypothetical protein